MQLRKKQTPAADISTELGADKRRRRADRGWGPFSGGQLTVIILGITIAIAFPVGAWAVSGTTVFPTDSVSGKTASVNALRQLSVAATGSVTATQTPPNSSYTYFGIATEGSCDAITPAVPAGKALVVTSITVEVDSVTTGPARAAPYSETSTPCDGELLDYIVVGGTKTSSVIPFTTGVPIKAGHKLSLVVASPSGDAFVNVTVHGYLVASTLCTVTGPPVGCY
jgi:hypothetical protein